MDAGIADTLNRRDAQLIAKHLDTFDAEMSAEMLLPGDLKPWHLAPIADTLMGENDSSNADRAWLVGIFAARTTGVTFDTAPADCDWDNLFNHLRAEVLARRDPSAHPVRAAEIPVPDGVGSR